MRYVIGDSARLVTPYRGYSWVTIIGYEGDGYCVELTSGLDSSSGKTNWRTYEPENPRTRHPEVQKGLAPARPF